MKILENFIIYKKYCQIIVYNLNYYLGTNIRYVKTNI